MNEDYRKFVRTLLVYVPYLKGVKPILQRSNQRIFGRPFEEEFYALKCFPDSADQLCLDVGGNHGLAVGAIRLFKPACRIISFEPNEPLAREIQRSYRNDHKVSVHACGLGDKETEVPLFVPVYRKVQFDGLASFYRSYAESSLGGKDIFLFRKKHVEIRELSCQIRTLDSLGLDPFFIKVDVQGSELSVLRGAEETLRRTRPVLLIESVTDEHMNFLANFGYNVYSYDRRRNSFLKDTRGKVNSFAMTEEKFRMTSGAGR